MESRSILRRRRVGAFLVVIGLLGGLFGVMGPLAEAQSVNPGTVGGFEIDGDQTSLADEPPAGPAGNTVDWVDFAGLTPAFDSDSLTVMIDAIGPDNGLQGSSDENDPEGFSCQDKDPTVTPGKDNIVRAYFNTRVTGPDSMFLDLGFVRDDGGTQGDTHTNFEFNQNPITNVCPYTSRTAGDILITFDFPGNSALAAVVNLYKWDPTIDEHPKPDGAWVPFTFAGAIAAEDNAADITDQIVGGTVLQRAFGEASIDLVALFEAAGNTEECASFGFASVRSRSSGQSFNSALQDILGGPVDISTCGKVIVHKTDDGGNALPGATFGLWPDAVAVPAVGAGGTRPSTGSIDTCVSIANGTCTFDDVPPGDYKVAEISPPAGYDIDPDVIDVTVGFRQTVDVAAPFVDPKDTGSVTITKRIWDDKNGNQQIEDGEILDLKVSGGVVYHDIDHNGSKGAAEPAVDLTGITFKLLKSGVQANTWPPPGSAAQCTIPAGALSCTIGPVLLGSYTITEEIDPAHPLPDGVSKGPDVPVTLTTDDQTVTANYDNPLGPINISLDKKGPDIAEVGDQITYTFDVSTTGVPLTIDQLVEVVDPANFFDDRCDAGTPLTGPDKSTTVDPQNDNDSKLEVGETWRWTCKHVVTLADATDADGTNLRNKAHVDGHDDVGRTVSADDTHTVVIRLPDLGVTKLAADGVDANGDASADETVDAPGTASYTIVVTNHGLGAAQNATLTDTLPPGSWTVTLASPDGDDSCPTTANPKTGSFTCTFGTLASGASKTVTVSRPVTIANDCAAVLTNNAGVTTTYQGGDLDQNNVNDSASAIVRVRCPDVGVVKSHEVSPVSAGQRIEWTITLTNNGAGVAKDVFLVDDVPAGLTDLQLGGANAADCDLDDHALTCDFGDVAPNDGQPGGPDTRVITISGLTDYAECGTVPNTADVASDEEGSDYEDSNASNNSDTDGIIVQCPNVWVEKSGPAFVNATDTITWTVKFGNDGLGKAFGVTMSDDLPTNLTGYVLGGPDANLCGIVGGDVVCNFAEMASGAEFEITITGTTDPADCPSVTNPAGIEADNEDPEDDEDNSASATTEVRCPDVDLEKVADDPSTVPAGDEIGFTITVTNSGKGVAYGVTVDDPLPSGDGIDWSIESQSGGAGCAIEGTAPDQTLVCGNDGSDVPADRFDLGPNESFTVHIVSDTDPTTDECVGGVLDNTATLTLLNGTEEDLSNNEDSAQVLCPGVNLAKVADDDLVEAGDQIGFKIFVTNLDDGEPPAEGLARDVVVKDQLPGDVDWSVAGDSDLPDGADCDIDEDNLLTCELGDLEPIDAADAPQVTIHLVAPTDEADCTTYDNTATATVDNGADPDDASDSTRVRCPIEIDLDKTGDTIAHVGDTVDYEFTVTNVGGEDLVNVDLTDPECNEGTITLVDDGDGDDVLAKGTWNGTAFVGGEVWAYTCQRTITEEDVVVVDGQDFALNTGTVTAEDEDGRPVDDDDPHEVLIITPDIEIVKTVDDDTPLVGQTVTFTYVVTNTGNTTLFDIQVVDDKLGPIGTIDELEPGESATLTKTMVVAADSPTRNVATADGEDVLGKHVDDDDDATITVVEAEVIVPPALPRTGANTDRMVLYAAMLLLFGGVMLVTSSALEPVAPRRKRR